MSEKCCGRDRGSAFCPDCGKALKSNPLMSLLAYLNATIKTLESGKDNARSRLGRWEHDERRTRNLNRQIKQADRVLPKWVTWRDALRSAIESGDATP